MNEWDRWIEHDGPEPEGIRWFLDALRGPPPATPEQKERAVRRFEAWFAAERSSGRLSWRAEPDEEAPSSGPRRRDVEEDAAPRASEVPELVPVTAEGPAATQPATLPAAIAAVSAAVAEEGPAAPPSPLLPIRVISVEGEPAAPPPAAGAPVPAAPAVPRPLQGLRVTAPLDPAAVAKGAQPFAPKEDEARRPKAGPTKVTPAAKIPRGTAPLGSPIEQARPALQPTPSTAAVPELTVEQYASYCVDMREMPARWREIMAAYRVPDDASRTALDEHWRKRCAGNPELAAALNAAMATYTAYRRSRRDR